MKKAVFLGASNTYGVSLWFHRNFYLDSKNYSNITWPYQQSSSDENYINTNRFSSLLSNYLNLHETNYSDAGGSPAQSLYLLSKMNLSEIEYVVFEFSTPTSFFDRFFLDKNTPKTPIEIESFLTNGKNDRPELRKRIYDWLENYNLEEYILEIFTKLKEFISNNKSIKFIILPWRQYDLDFSLEHYKWILNYTPKFSINSNKNNVIVEDFLLENNFTIKDEFKHIGCLKDDLHPSLNGHKKIFEILKNYIDEKNSTNSW